MAQIVLFIPDNRWGVQFRQGKFLRRDRLSLGFERNSPNSGRVKMCNGWLFIIDDDEAMLSLLGEFLDSVGYQVRPFRSASDAVREIEESPELSVKAVISDIHMPSMNGIELMEWMGERITAPVILLSAFGSSELEKKALDAGASFFMKKPFALSALKQVLEHLLKAS